MNERMNQWMNEWNIDDFSLNKCCCFFNRGFSMKLTWGFFATETMYEMIWIKHFFNDLTIHGIDQIKD